MPRKFDEIRERRYSSSLWHSRVPCLREFFRDARRSRDRGGRSAAETASAVAVQRARGVRDATRQGTSIPRQ